MAWEDEHPPVEQWPPRATLRRHLGGCMFELTVFPDHPDDDPPVDDDPVMAQFAPPKFVTFGDLDFDLILVGYVMPAPELGWSDYPVAQKWPGNDEVIQLGGDTPSGPPRPNSTR